jgi:hypothetical protein
VFEDANRIVVEKPGAAGGTRYATYLFELESAVPVDAQARRSALWAPPRPCFLEKDWTSAVLARPGR